MTSTDGTNAARQRSALRRTNLKDSVAAFIRELIFSGQLRPGTKVDQDDIAEQLGVSKLPVREALIALETEALIRNLPRRGAYVAPLTPADVRDHYRIYGLVSALAAERAARELSDEQLDELEQILERMEQEPVSPDEQEELNFRFHRIINQAGGSARLNSVLRLLANSIPTRFYEFTAGWSERAADHHRRVVEALRRHDGDAAAKAMHDHLSEGGDYAVDLLTRSGFWDDDEDDTAAASLE